MWRSGMSRLQVTAALRKFWVRVLSRCCHTVTFLFGKILKE